MLLEPVDGTHIPIQRPRTQFHQRYINRKGYHSIISDRILLLSGITSKSYCDILYDLCIVDETAFSDAE